MTVAAVLLCMVIGIADGDTLTARCDVPEGKTNVTVRLAEVDAPEKDQAFGSRSKQHLSDVCFQKTAVVRSRAKDRYGRRVAFVECDGVDASAQQVHAGMAWVFDRYVTNLSLYAVQDEARAERRGLWVAHEPVAPWEWRRTKRQQ
jgi:endonuclease YncB( thermonuclease family)